MKNKKHIHNEIIKLRKLVALSSATEKEKETAWCAMLSLQWVLSKDFGPISPTTICKPNLGLELKK